MGQLVKRLVVSVSVSVLLLGLSPVAEASTTTYLTIAGSGSSTTEWNVLRPTTILVQDNARDLSVQVRGGKTYVGFLIETASGAYVAGAVHPKDFEFSARIPLLAWLGPRRETLSLRPGRYRVTFLGDAPGAITLPVPRGLAADLAIRPRTSRPNVRSGWVDFGAAQIDPLTAAAVRVQINRNARVAAYTINVVSAPEDDEANVCVRPARAARCSQLDGDYSGGGTTIGVGGTGAGLTGVWAAPGFFPPGDYVASFAWRTVGLITRQAGFVIGVV